MAFTFEETGAWEDTLANLLIVSILVKRQSAPKANSLTLEKNLG